MDNIFPFLPKTLPLMGYQATGSEKWTCVPFPGTESIRIFPFCASTSRLQIVNPKPRRALESRVATISSWSKIFRSFSFGIPAPESETQMTANPSSFFPERRIVPWKG